MTDLIARAEAAVAELLACYRAARSETERVAVSKIIAGLSPGGSAALAELAARALDSAREPGR